MHRLLTLGLLGSLILLPGQIEAQKKSAAKKGWINNLEKGKEEARKTGKPIFLVFRCEP